MDRKVYEIIFYIELAFFLVSFVVLTAGFLYFHRKKIQPIYSRSVGLMLFFHFSLLANFALNFVRIIIVGKEPCFVNSIFASFAGSALAVSSNVIILRLVFIFEVAKRRTQHRGSTDSEEKQNNPEILQPKYLSDRYFAYLIAAIMMILSIIPIISIGLEIAENNTSCSLGYQFTQRSMVVIFVVVCFSFFVWKLRKIHDAYYMKRELSLVLGIATFLGIPAVLLSLYASLRLFSIVLVSVAYILLQYCSFGMLCYISWKNRNYVDNTPSPMLSMSSYSNSGEDPGPQKFEHYPIIISLLNDEKASKYLDNFLIHYQKITMVDYLNFWRSVQAFKALPQEFLAGKGYLLYQKFIKLDAYRYIDCVTEEQRKKIGDILNDAVQEDSTTVVESTIFDEILENVEVSMVEHLFVQFFKSEFYLQYKEVIRLNEAVGEYVEK